MATIVDTNVTPPRVLDSVDVLDYLRDEHVQSDGKGKRWHALNKTSVAAALKPGLLLNPDLSLVREASGRAKLPARYWKPGTLRKRVNEKDVDVPALLPMTEPEKAAVDLALNPPDPERDAVHAILEKADADITAAERTRILLRMARKLKARGEL